VIYEVVHRTRYDYDGPVTVSLGQVHQLAADVDGQRCLRCSLAISPEPEHKRERRDYFGNRAAVFSIREPHTRLEVTTSALVDATGRPERFGADGDRPWETVIAVEGRDAAPTDRPPLEVVEFALDSTLVTRSAGLADYARQSFAPRRGLAEAVTELSSRIHADFAFDPEATDVDTPLEEVVERRRGVCQDFAHVMIGCLRSLGLAARYVSGYLETIPPPGQRRLVGADRTHAWVGVHTGDGSWIGVDPTNDRLAGRRYVTTAHGRDYADVPPLKGVIFTDAEESVLTVSVDVVPSG